jgi:hypothetical protein
MAYLFLELCEILSGLMWDNLVKCASAPNSEFMFRTAELASH